jgi:chromosome partitioning protein
MIFNLSLTFDLFVPGRHQFGDIRRFLFSLVGDMGAAGMDIVAIASRKGGSGKTTLAGHLAVQAERADGRRVALIDTDPQGSLADWWNVRAAETPRFVQTSGDRLEADLERLRRTDIDLVIIDTPPAMTESVAATLRPTDIVIVPTRPSPHDLRSIGATVALADELGKPLLFVLNGAAPRARITNEAVSVLSRSGTLVPAIVHQRVDFASSMIDGRTVLELPDSNRAAEEIEQVWRYLADRLSNQARRFVMPDLPVRSALARPLPQVRSLTGDAA